MIYIPKITITTTAAFLAVLLMAEVSFTYAQQQRQMSQSHLLTNRNEDEAPNTLPDTKSSLYLEVF